MRRTLAMVTLLALVFTVTPLTTGAYAVTALQICTVEQAGINSDTGDVEIFLYRADVDATKKFVAPTAEANRMLAVALTAMSSGMQVKVMIDWQVWASEIDWIRLTN